MKATIVIAALALTLSTVAQAQSNYTENQPQRGNPARQMRGQGGPQFRGGYDQDLNQGGNRIQRRLQNSQWRGALGNGARNGNFCPQCGEPVRQRMRQGRGPGSQDVAGAPGNGRGRRLGPAASDGQTLVLGPNQRGRGWRQGTGPTERPGNGPRGRGFGGGGLRNQGGWSEPEVE